MHLAKRRRRKRKMIMRWEMLRNSCECFFSCVVSFKEREFNWRRAYDSLLCSGEWMSRETKKLNRREDGNGWKHKKKRGKKNEKRFVEEQFAEVVFKIYLFSLVWFLRVPTCLWFLYNPSGKFLVFSRAFHEWNDFQRLAQLTLVAPHRT